MQTGNRLDVQERKKVLVLGASGMAGHMVTAYLRELGHTVTSAARTECRHADSVVLDVFDRQGLDRLLKNDRYDTVINCVGALVQESSGAPVNAAYLNAFLPQYLSYQYQRSDTQVIHLSTDCVFSGNAGPYAEDDFRDGDTYYDRSKALGEINGEKDLTLRMSIIGPEIRPDGTGLMHWFLGQRGRVPGYSQAMWNGITTLELAKVIGVLLHDRICGVYHMVPNITLSKFELLCIIRDVFGRIDLDVVPTDTVRIDKSLLDTRDELPYDVVSSGYLVMLEELRDWINEHPSLYAQDARYVLPRMASVPIGKGQKGV